MPSRRISLITRIVLMLFAASIVGSLVALLHPVSIRVHASTYASEFIRLDRWHLVFCQQWVQAVVPQPGSQVDTSIYGHFSFTWPDSPSASQVYGPDIVMFPRGAWFRRFNQSAGGFMLSGKGDGPPLQHCRCFAAGLEIPFWFLILVLGIWPAIWFLRDRRLRKRQRTGLCLVCGYDLRASPDRCPECGQMPAAR